MRKMRSGDAGRPFKYKYEDHTVVAFPPKSGTYRLDALMPDDVGADDYIPHALLFWFLLVPSR